MNIAPLIGLCAYICEPLSSWRLFHHYPPKHSSNSRRSVLLALPQSKRNCIIASNKSYASMRQIKRIRPLIVQLTLATIRRSIMVNKAPDTRIRTAVGVPFVVQNLKCCTCRILFIVDIIRCSMVRSGSIVATSTVTNFSTL